MIKKTAAKKKKAVPAKKKMRTVTASGDARTLALVAAQAAFDKKAFDVVVLDVRGLSPIADMMVVASARSSTNVKSVVDNVVAELQKIGVRPAAKEHGRERDSNWILLDFFDVLVHVMLTEQRALYRLENLYEGAAVIAQFH